MRRKWIVFIGLPVVLAVFAYFGTSALLYSRLTTVQPHCDGEFAGNTPASFSAAPFAPDLDTSPYFMPGYEAVSIASRDAGITLSGWYVPGQPDAPAVLIVHGLGAGAADCKRNPRALLPAGMLHRVGYNVLLIDLRDHGDSTIEDGKWAAGTEEYRDVLGAWDWLQTVKGIPTARIGLFGYSGGTAAALIAMGEEPRIPAIWLDSPFADITETISDRLARDGYPRFLTAGGLLMAQILSGDDLDALTPGSAAAKLGSRAAFIVHCEADTALPVDYAYELAGILRLPKERLWIAPDCDHVRAMFVYRAEYQQRVTAFFDAYLRMS